MLCYVFGEGVLPGLPACKNGMIGMLLPSRLPHHHHMHIKAQAQAQAQAHTHTHMQTVT